MLIIILIILGCIIISLFDVLGSVLSRKLNFNYAWLTVGSIIILGSIAVQVSIYSSFLTGVISSSLVGAFDAYFGMKIAKKFKANINQSINYTTNLKMVIIMSVFGSIIGFISILIFI